MKQSFSWLAKPENSEDLWIVQGLDHLFGVLNWLPVWLTYIAFLLFGIVGVVVGLTEYAVRYLLTPAKIWDMYK